MRPEAMDLQDTPLSEIVDQAAMLKLFAPGDVVCSFRFKNWLTSIWLLLDESRLKQGKDWEKVANYVMRMVMRRGFPRPGAAAILGIELKDYWHGSSDYLDYGLVMDPEENGSKTILQEVLEIPHMQKQMLLPLVVKLCGSYDLRRWEDTSPLVYQTVDEQSGFLVVSVRKCCRGPPLVPSLPSGCRASSCIAEKLAEWFSWEEAQDLTNFNLSSYLQHILSLCGMETTVVFDSLDGRRLVFFQAVVRRAVWSKLWETLQPILKKQQSAYRRHYGGSGAPHIQVDVQPRFDEGTMQAVVRECQPSPSSTDLPPSEEAAYAWQVQIKNTFVHFTTDDAQSEVGSLP
mmetsp:Transcript_25623/g.82721  ORF Transcript_25623/g.82721 Transcript_25623/m.82721 type:complete len:345 (+) Transcript_25623:112-1146(+)